MVDFARLAMPLGEAITTLRAIRRFTVRPVLPEPLRISPHERADEVGPAEAGAALRPVRREGAWVLAESSPGRLGWLPASALMFVSE